ncbi:MAG: hypothetical protein JSR68_16460 [Proteobacteria bacterium]|nr:hypothetical protein [Pseudomonadota bacterium]
MNHPIIQQQAQTPASIHLLRYLPRRRDFNWRALEPAAVRSAGDLPPYLILGELDEASFKRSNEGWSARWRGTEADTWFELAHDAAGQQWVAEDRWRGIKGSITIYKTCIPLPVVIGQAMYGWFPENWDRAAKTRLEASYQLQVIEPQKGAPSMCGIPDGPVRTLAFPIAVGELRGFRDHLRRCLERWQLPYPVAAEARLTYQGVCWHEGEAPSWADTTRPEDAFRQSVQDTGLVPFGYPRRSEVPDKPAAWTHTRELYFVYLTLPFAGLTDLLRRLASSQGPVRRLDDPPLPFEWRPMVLSAGLEHLVADLTLDDDPRTTLVYLRFQPLAQWGKAVTVGKLVDQIRSAEDDLARAEAISAGIVTHIERIVERMDKK